MTSNVEYYCLVVKILNWEDTLILNVIADHNMSLQAKIPVRQRLSIGDIVCARCQNVNGECVTTSVELIEKGRFFKLAGKITSKIGRVFNVRLDEIPSDLAQFVKDSNAHQWKNVQFTEETLRRCRLTPSNFENLPYSRVAIRVAIIPSMTLHIRNIRPYQETRQDGDRKSFFRVISVEPIWEETTVHAPPRTFGTMSRSPSVYSINSVNSSSIQQDDMWNHQGNARNPNQSAIQRTHNQGSSSSHGGTAMYSHRDRESTVFSERTSQDRGRASSRTYPTEEHKEGRSKTPVPMPRRPRSPHSQERQAYNNSYNDDVDAWADVYQRSADEKSAKVQTKSIPGGDNDGGTNRSGLQSAKRNVPSIEGYGRIEQIHNESSFLTIEFNKSYVRAYCRHWEPNVIYTTDDIVWVEYVMKGNNPDVVAFKLENTPVRRRLVVQITDVVASSHAIGQILTPSNCGESGSVYMPKDCFPNLRGTDPLVDVKFGDKFRCIAINQSPISTQRGDTHRWLARVCLPVDANDELKDIDLRTTIHVNDPPEEEQTQSRPRFGRRKSISIKDLPICHNFDRE